MAGKTPSVVFVAAASANTGAAAVRQLSAVGGLEVRALFRKADDPRAEALASLPGVKIVVGDFAKPEGLAPLLAGVDRAFLVMGAFDYGHFEAETQFLKQAVKAGVEAVVRIGTASALTTPGTTCAYGRAHHGIESYIRAHKLPVVTISSNWFMSNVLGSAAEAKASGKVSWPAGDAVAKSAFIDPRDVAGAAVTVMLLPSEKLAPFIAAGTIEAHGPEMVNFADQAKAITKAVGYEVAFQEVPSEAWVDVMVGYGLERVFAQSFCDTIRFIGGTIMVEPMGPERPVCETSKILVEAGWKPVWTLEKWANDAATIAAFKKQLSATTPT